MVYTDFRVVCFIFQTTTNDSPTAGTSETENNEVQTGVKVEQDQNDLDQKQEAALTNG